MKETELYWLSGIVEGEGCFTWDKNRHRPQVYVGMTDEDVMERVAELMQTSLIRTHSPSHKDKGFKPTFHAKVMGQRAIYLIDVLYPLLGKRRQTRADELKEMYNNRPNKKRSRLIESPYRN